MILFHDGVQHGLFHYEGEYYLAALPTVAEVIE